MRILIATHHLSVVGGVETYLKTILKAMQAHGHELSLLHDTQPVAGRETILDEKSGVSTWCTAGFRDAELLQQIKSWRPDVVYAHSLSSPRFEGELADRWPTVLFAHAYYGTCLSGTKCFRYPQIRPCERTEGWGCIACYFPRGCGGRSPMTLPRLIQRVRDQRQNLSRFRKVLVASKHMYREFLRHGVQGHRITVAPLFPAGVVRDAVATEKTTIGGQILFVGRMTANKGTEHLVKSLAAAQSELKMSLSVNFVGDGPEASTTQILAGQLGIKSKWMGWLSSEAVIEQMRLADVLAIPSLWPEPFGMVGVEAACVSLPAVGYASGGITDWLIPGVTGESAPSAPPTVQELSQAFVRALSSQEHLNQLRRQAWLKAEEFTLDRHLKVLLENLYSAVSMKS